jgi:adhesin transport system outer membrane protein
VGAADAEARALEAEYRSARWLRYPNLSVEGLVATRGSNFADRDGITANVALE